MGKIFTHQTVDLDAVLSVCVLWRFVKGMKEAEVEFRPSNWDGEGMGPFDVAIDMEAGGRGVKGHKENGTVHSCFALLMARYAPPEIYKSMWSLVEYVDLQDSTGNAVNVLFPDSDSRSRAIISSVSLLSVFYALREKYRSDLEVVKAMYPIFCNIVRIAEKRIDQRDSLVSFDTALSVCVLWYFVPGMEDVVRLDAVSDVDAREQEKVRSRFALLMSKHAPAEIYKSLRNFAEYVDLQSSTGDAVSVLFPGSDNRSRAIISSASLLSVFYALRETCESDLDVVNAIYPIFSGMVRLVEKRIEEIRTIQVEYFGEGREVALLLSDGETQPSHLFGRGVQLLIYSNSLGFGVMRNSKSPRVVGFRVDHPSIRAVVDAAGEEIGNGTGKWFAHDSGFLFCRGSRTSPAPDRSKVDPREFAKAVLAAWEEYKNSLSAPAKEESVASE